MVVILGTTPDLINRLTGVNETTLVVLTTAAVHLLAAEVRLVVALRPVVVVAEVQEEVETKQISLI